MEAGSYATIRNGSDLLAAFFNTLVNDALVVADCDLTEGLWTQIPTGNQLPVVISRNLTIRGDPSVGRVPLLRLNYVKSKVSTLMGRDDSERM